MELFELKNFRKQDPLLYWLNGILIIASWSSVWLSVVVGNYHLVTVSAVCALFASGILMHYSITFKLHRIESMMSKSETTNIREERQ